MKKLFCIIIALIMLLSSACGAAPQTAAPASEAPEQAEQTEPAATADEPEAVEAAPEETDAAKLSIESRTELSGEYTDDIGNTDKYSYSLPKVVCDTDYAECVNAEIDDLYEKFILPELDRMEDGYSLVTLSSSWQKSEFNGITSLALIISSCWDSDGIYVWNFTADGEEASNAAVLEAVGMTPEEFIENAGQALKDELSYDPDGKSDEIIKALDENLENTLSEENLNTEMPLAVTGDGGLMFCAKVYSIAGAGYYYRLYRLLPEGGYEEINGFTAEPETYAITLVEKSSYTIVSCPGKAAAGETVTIETYDICDGEVKITVDGADDGAFTDSCIYQFTMPECDVTVTAWISTEGFAGA